MTVNVYIHSRSPFLYKLQHLLMSKEEKATTTGQPFVSLPERMPQPGERGRQLSPSSRLPRCFAVPPG
ncbi:hypothetical protein HMPREF0083_04840 [Aneurinibacillus aneurinilyticus ATCC 12856]|uniref:Uncharacterized protein n=1 Tax=Aneurinibacillus aneurinilyticus ATCC 12856 TaxID=649747 RepID=U1WWJ6_ANEAE|nr:hypothetical protein HMPREF0083_04840 [Aneurinibacillus aneurinilyticus ATCC 12856]